MEAVVEDTRRREFERRHGGARDSPPGYQYCSDSDTVAKVNLGL
jgi:hypothetical protein